MTAEPPTTRPSSAPSTTCSPTNSATEATTVAFSFGAATKGELLTAAVSARATSAALEELLGLPDRTFRSTSELAYWLNRPGTVPAGHLPEANPEQYRPHRLRSDDYGLNDRLA